MNGEPIHVLLIEDNPGDVRFVQELLRPDSGPIFEVEPATRLASGLALVGRGAIDVVLLDLGLPDSDALATFTKLHDAAPRLPIVVLSGATDEHLAVEAVKSGAQDYLLKRNVNRAILTRALRYAIERKKVEEDLRQSERELTVRQAIADVFLTVPGEDMFAKALDVLLAATGSRSGVFGYIDHDGALLCPSFIDAIWDQCRMPEKCLRFPRETWGGIWGRALIENRTLYSNEPRRVPPGHVPIDCILVAPIVFHGETIGIFEVANRPSGYTGHDVEFLERIAQNVAPILRARLQRDAEERARRQAEEALRRLNQELEFRVRDRTADLLAANDELEAFCYSVSHDLRAPLRSINGFSAVLAADYGPNLPDAARQLLQRVQKNAAEMGTLIDELLALSRTTRQPLNIHSVRPASIARDAVEQLRSDLQDRYVNIHVGDLPDCLADPALLKQVFLNLLSNAFKFTRSREAASVEVGATSAADVPPPCDCDPDAIVYYVRDNGVGFDMRYAGNLFGAFQRLHPATQYEGTGVGLAIVQRIMHRHGGRVWAHAEVGKGATFYFMLGNGHRCEAAKRSAHLDSR